MRSLPTRSGPVLGRARLHLRLGPAIRRVRRSHALASRSAAASACSSSMPGPAWRPSGTSSGRDAPDKIDILLSHLHLDHIGGLPFFKPALLGDRLIRTYCGNLGGQSAKAAARPPLFAAALSDPPRPAAGPLRASSASRPGETLRFGDGHARRHASPATIRTAPPATASPMAAGSSATSATSSTASPGRRPDLVRFVARRRPHDLRRHVLGGRVSALPAAGAIPPGRRASSSAAPPMSKALAIFHLHPGHDDAFLRAAEAEMQAVMPTAFVARERQAVTLSPASPSRPDSLRNHRRLGSAAGGRGGHMAFLAIASGASAVRVRRADRGCLWPCCGATRWRGRTPARATRRRRRKAAASR